jgi:O-antigen/teichoic acid export membrane protein
MGAYVVVLSLSRMLNLFQNSVVMVLFPKAAGHAEETVLALTGRSMRISTLITLVASITVAVLGPVLLRVLYGREYVAGLASLRILLVEVTISGAVYILAQAFMALGRPGIVTVLQAIGLGLSVPLMLWLIPIWGIQGAAVSLLISTTVRFAFIYFGFPIFLKTHPPRLFPERRDFDLLPALFRHHRTEIER